MNPFDFGPVGSQWTYNAISEMFLRRRFVEIPEVRLDVLVDGMGFNLHSIDRGWGHAPNVGNRAVRHEPTAEPFHVARDAVFARLNDDHAKHPGMIRLEPELHKVAHFLGVVIFFWAWHTATVLPASIASSSVRTSSRLKPTVAAFRLAHCVPARCGNKRAKPCCPRRNLLDLRLRKDRDCSDPDCWNLRPCLEGKRG